jgi:hypothetical protein
MSFRPAFDSAKWKGRVRLRPEPWLPRGRLTVESWSASALPVSSMTYAYEASFPPLFCFPVCAGYYLRRSRHLRLRQSRGR